MPYAKCQMPIVKCQLLKIKSCNVVIIYTGVDGVDYYTRIGSI